MRLSPNRTLSNSKKRYLPCRRPARFRPRAELLEDRLVPAQTLHVGSLPTEFSTIQAAVSAANAGDTIQVDPGTYHEHVVIDKSLTLLGANAGVNPVTTARGPESVVDGDLTGAPFAIQANNVTLDGFKIIDGQNGLNAGVATGTVSGYTIEDNIITHNTIGVYANSSGPAIIQNNLFDANNLSGPAGGAAIYSDAGTNGLVVRGNEFKNHTLNNPVIFGATAATSNTNLQFVDNSLHDNNFGVFALKVVHGLFEGNTISTTDPGGATALTIADGSSDVQVIHNVFQNNARGLRVMDFGFGVSSGPISGVVVHFNSFINNTQFGLFVDAGSYSGTVNAQNNFWGSPSGPTTPANPGGTGDQVIGPVDSTAWLITPPGTATTLFWKDAAGNILTVDTVTGDYAFFGADGTVVAGDGARVQKGVLKIHDHGTGDQKIDVSGPANGRITVNLRGKNKKDFTLNSVPDPSSSV